MVILTFQDNISFQKPLCYTKSAALRIPLFSVATTQCAVRHAKYLGYFVPYLECFFVSLPYIYKQQKKKTINYGKD